MTPFVDIFGNIIGTLTGKEVPFYEYGHPIDIVNSLGEKTANDILKYSKYPLIMLFQDFKEEHITVNEYIIPDLTVVIATDTKPQYKAVDRYTETIKPILYPIYEDLIFHMANSNLISWDMSDHVKIDRLFWGKTGIYGNKANIFNDYLDAVEINFKNIKVINKC